MKILLIILTVFLSSCHITRECKCNKWYFGGSPITGFSEYPFPPEWRSNKVDSINSGLDVTWPHSDSVFILNPIGVIKTDTTKCQHNVVLRTMAWCPNQKCNTCTCEKCGYSWNCY